MGDRNLLAYHWHHLPAGSFRSYGRVEIRSRSGGWLRARDDRYLGLYVPVCRVILSVIEVSHLPAAAFPILLLLGPLPSGAD